jgi:hypothetical protein
MPSVNAPPGLKTEETTGPLAASVHGAALAETGDMAGALAVVKSALERARASGATGLVPQLEAQVADYGAGRPTRAGKRGK